MEFIKPIVEERSARMKEFGENWDEAPVRQPILFEFVLHYSYDGAQSDMLMWLMSDAKGVERSLEGWSRRLLGLDFASIHTTTIVSCSARLFFPPISSFLIVITHQRRRSHKHSIAC